MDLWENEYVGEKFTIRHCIGAMKSYEKACKSLSPVKKKRTVQEKLRKYIEMLADGQELSTDSFPFEGRLPDESKFRALKKIPIRAYVWKSKKYENTYFISHYVFKDFDKLSASDSNKVEENWRKIEE